MRETESEREQGNVGMRETKNEREQGNGGNREGEGTENKGIGEWGKPRGRGEWEKGNWGIIETERERGIRTVESGNYRNRDGELGNWGWEQGNYNINLCFILL